MGGVEVRLRWGWGGEGGVGVGLVWCGVEGEEWVPGVVLEFAGPAMGEVGRSPGLTSIGDGLYASL